MIKQVGALWRKNLLVKSALVHAGSDHLQFGNEFEADLEKELWWQFQAQQSAEMQITHFDCSSTNLCLACFNWTREVFLQSVAQCQRILKRIKSYLCFEIRTQQHILHKIKKDICFSAHLRIHLDLVGTHYACICFCFIFLFVLFLLLLLFLLLSVQI